jgi:hypothetical protein
MDTPHVVTYIEPREGLKTRSFYSLDAAEVFAQVVANATTYPAQIFYNTAGETTCYGTVSPTHI